MDNSMHRTWAEVDLDTIEQNFKEIAAQVNHAPVLCVIKANAYGHGSIPIAKRLQNAGAAYFGVATVPEAVELREQGITLPILILGYIDEADAPLIARYDITAAVYDRETAEMFSAAAVAENRPIQVHFKLDTGMGRLGFDAFAQENTVQEILSIAKLPGLKPTGIFTHFSVADEADGSAYTQAQKERFAAVCDALEAQGLHLPQRHCANSGAILQHPDTYCTMVRAGLILYGYYPDPNAAKPIPLKPAMTLKARVVQVRETAAGHSIGYGRTYETNTTTRIAVLSIGYADGYFRTCSHAKILLNGQVVPVVGRICMDMCMVALPDALPVHRGDTAIIFGAESITADDVASYANTISYEVLCAVSSRVPRIYLHECT